MLLTTLIWPFGIDVQGPVEVPQDHDAERHPLDHAALARRLDDVADRELVLDQHEEAGDDVLHQALGPERHGEAEDAGAGQDRADVDEQVEGEQHGDGDDDHPAHAPEQLGDGLAAALRSVVTESSPSSTAVSMRRAASRTSRSANQASSQMPSTRAPLRIS